jgi:phage tail tape-measure protein
MMGTAPESTPAEDRESDVVAAGQTESRFIIGKLGGAATGAALGAIVGPAGILAGGAIGAVIGDEYEKRVRRRDTASEDLPRGKPVETTDNHGKKNSDRKRREDRPSTIEPDDSFLEENPE